MMNNHRLLNSHFIDLNNNTVVNVLLAKSVHEQTSHELMRVIDHHKYSRKHQALVNAVLVLDQQNILKKIMDEQRHCGASSSSK